LPAIEVESRFNNILAEYGKLLRHAIASQCSKNIGLDFDDLMQEARLRLWRAVSSERNIRDLPSYLYRIAATVTIDAIRSVKARREEQMNIEPGGEPEYGQGQRIDTNASPETAADCQQLIAILRATLARLPENRRRAVGLHLQGFTTTEIGELMHWSEAKARNLVYRGLDDLRSQLRAQGFEYETE
jgi:RNA polymerase sigma-70 factor (ECF subfamily)